MIKPKYDHTAILFLNRFIGEKKRNPPRYWSDFWGRIPHSKSIYTSITASKKGDFWPIFQVVVKGQQRKDSMKKMLVICDPVYKNSLK